MTIRPFLTVLALIAAPAAAQSAFDRADPGYQPAAESMGALCQQSGERAAPLIERIQAQGTDANAGIRAHACAALKIGIIGQWMNRQCANDPSLDAARRQQSAEQARRHARLNREGAAKIPPVVSPDDPKCDLSDVEWTGLVAHYEIPQSAFDHADPGLQRRDATAARGAFDHADPGRGKRDATAARGAFDHADPGRQPRDSTAAQSAFDSGDLAHEMAEWKAAERRRIAREKAEREERERIARLEAERKERERIARLEAEREERERIARLEAERKERQRQERIAAAERRRQAEANKGSFWGGIGKTILGIGVAAGVYEEIRKSGGDAGDVSESIGSSLSGGSSGGNSGGSYGDCPESGYRINKYGERVGCGPQ